MKKLFWLSAIVIGIIGAALCPDKPRPNKYERAQSQTVLIKTETGSGSGFVIQRISVEDGRPRLFVWTANHVIDDVDEVEVHRILHYNGHRAGEMVFKANVILRLPCDAALLFLNAPPGIFTLTEISEGTPLPIGTPIFHVGNLLGIMFEGSVMHGYSSQIGLAVGPWSAVDQADLSAAPGASGGPVYQYTSGAVVGILVGGPNSATMRIVCYVPVRVFERAAVEKHFGWAVRGHYCPGDAVLSAAATAALLPKKADVNQKPDSGAVEKNSGSINHMPPHPSAPHSPKHATGG